LNETVKLRALDLRQNVQDLERMCCVGHVNSKKTNQKKPIKIAITKEIEHAMVISLTLCVYWFKDGDCIKAYLGHAGNVDRGLKCAGFVFLFHLVALIRRVCESN
jgi:hypothetical protein